LSVRFSSKEYDQASGLCYFGYRHYSPSLGRWLVVDPFADNILIHEFAYSENSPLRYVDASGGAAVDVLPPARNSPPRRIRIKPREPRTLMPRYEPIPGRAYLSLNMCIADCWEHDAATPSGVVPDIVQRCARAPNPGSPIPTMVSLLTCVRDCLTPTYWVNGLGPWYSWGDPFPVPDVEVSY